MNDAKILPQGGYVLSVDVTNPKPDKRSTSHWTAAAVWKQGMRLFVREENYGHFDDHKTIGYAIENVDSRYTHISIHRFKDGTDRARWDAITPHMVLVPVNLDYLLHRLGAGGFSKQEILRELLKVGKVTLGDIEEAYKRAMREPDAGVKDALET